MERTKLHPLETILSIVLLGVLAGVDSWTGFEEYAQDHQDTLKHFIDLSSGVPSHDTIARVISTLDVKAFERAFHRFTATLVEKFQGIIALDGKTLRGSFDHRKGVKAGHIVSAWADCCPLVLAQVKVDDKSNEITATPELLALLDLQGQIVTLDAMGCQREICKQIVDQGGDDVISLRGNQGTLHQDVRLFFEDSQSVIEEIGEESDKGHGRVENRLCKATAEIDWLQKTHDWPGLGSIAAVRGRRETRTGVCEETRYYVSSLPADAERIGRAARAHLGCGEQIALGSGCDLSRRSLTDSQGQWARNPKLNPKMGPQLDQSTQAPHPVCQKNASKNKPKPSKPHAYP